MIFDIKLIVNKRGAPEAPPHPLPYQLYIKKVIKIHGKTCKGYVKICKKYTKKKFMHRKFMYFFRSLYKCSILLLCYLVEGLEHNMGWKTEAERGAKPQEQN